MRERDDGRAGDGDPDVKRARADAGAGAVGGACAVVVTIARDDGGCFCMLRVDG